MTINLRSVLKAVLPVLTLGAAATATVMLVQTAPAPAREARTESRTLVEVTQARMGRQEVVLRAHGTVIPARQVVLQPELSGRVIWQAPSLTPGGMLRSGDSLVRIDARDYRLAVEARNSEISRARLELQLERSRQDVARQEWESFGRPSPAPTPSAERSDEEAAPDEDEGSLALREPQLRTAQVGVDAARSAMQKARLDLQRTTLRAPFNATVEEESVELGQVVGPQSQLARLVGTDEFWVRVSVPLDALPSISLPRGDRLGARATVRQRIRGEEVVREGRVVRLLPSVEAQGAMAQLLVSIPDPLGLAEGAPEGLPILLRTYVEVDIETAPLDAVVEVPRAAVHEGARVYVMGQDDRLELREIVVAWSRPETVLVSRGLAEGDRIITSFLPTPLPGMALRTAAPRAEEPGR